MEKKNRYLRKKDSTGKWLTISLFLISVFVLVTVAGIRFLSEPETVTLPNGEVYTQPPDTETIPNSISIPGYEAIHLTADSLSQKICFSNPVQNACLFRVSLYLEDGELLWTSNEFKPGEVSNAVELLRPLQQGTYPNAVLLYECFSMGSEHTPLNGAKTKLTLFVN